MKKSNWNPPDKLKPVQKVAPPVNVAAISAAFAALLLAHEVDGTPLELQACVDIMYANGFDDDWGGDDDCPGPLFNPVMVTQNLKVNTERKEIAFRPDVSSVWTVVGALSTRVEKRPWHGGDN